MKIYHKFLLYQNKWIHPYVRMTVGVMTSITYLASILLIVGVVYDHGFTISEAEAHQLQRLYHGVWIVFLVDVTLRILLEYKDTRRTFSKLTWILTILLYLTLIPVIFHRPEEEGAILQFWEFLHGKAYHLVLLLVFSFFSLSNGLVRLLGRRTNPSLILAASFLIIIMIGTGLLMLPRCTMNGISWVDSLFISTSAVCVTGLTSVDVASTFTPTGFVVIILLIQIGGLGVMTLTSFFAMFFMGNTSLYNQLVVRDMVSSNSLNSLLSTLVYILAFTLVIEGIGMLAIWGDIHGTMGMDLQEELAFSAFHAISAFCNAGFSTLPGNLGNPLVMTGHNPFFIYISLLIILGGIGFPILVNFKDIILYHLRRLWHFLRTWHWDGKRFYHLYNLNTKIVLIVTFLLLVLGTVGIAVFEWNAAFAGMSVADKWTQAFFNATCPRTAGFTSVDLAGLGVQTLLIYLFLMWVGGGSQSTAGGIKVNAFAVVVLNLVAVYRKNRQKEVNVSLDYQRTSDLMIGDRDQLLNVVSNLMENSVKYSGDIVNIHVACRDIGKGEVMISVSDNGIGISSDEQQRVWTKFYRSNTYPDMMQPGIGLGLSFVDMIVKAHGGRKMMQSEVGKGTRISIVIPQHS